MYTSQKSIENKVGVVEGWRDLLISVGFRLEPGANGVPASVFFPQSDPGERLTQASASLQAILGLSPTSWKALAKIVAEGDEAADEIIALFRQIVAKFHEDDGDVPIVEVSASVRVWRTPGCHELLASLGFDLMGVDDEEVTLRGGRTAGKRQAQFALQSLLALFDTQDAPRCIEVDDGEETSSEDERQSETSEAPEDDLPAPPFPAPRKSDLVLGSEGGAFTSYVRRTNRGEPDGRQAGNGDSPPASAYPASAIPPPPLPPTISAAGAPSLAMYQAHTKGHESDCNFTPSPVNPVPKLVRGIYGHQHSQQPHSHAGPFAYGQQRRVPSDHSPAASDKAGQSTSSANSSLAEWKPSVIRPNSVHLQNRFEQAMHGLSEAVSGGRSPSNGSSSGYAPLYENSEVTYSSRQPAGKPVMPIRSVFTDVGYGSTQKITDKGFDPNDKFSVRAEAGKNLLHGLPVKKQPSAEIVMDARLNPGVTRRVPPTGESDSPENTMNSGNKRSSMINAETASVTTTSSANTFIIKSDDGGYGHTVGHKKLDSNASSSAAAIDLSEINIHDSIRSTQLRRLTRDNNQYPIGETFQDSHQSGLGLAPPLSTIIMSNNLQVVQVDHHSDSEGSSKNTSLHRPNGPTKEESLNNFDNASAIEAVHLKSASRLQDPPSKRRPPIPPKPPAEWNGGSTAPFPPVPAARPMARDEGDGRSMTDSQYSGYSPNGQPPKLNGHHHHHHPSADKVAARLGYLKMQDYINQQDIITVVEEDEKQSQQSGPAPAAVVTNGIPPQIGGNVGKFVANFEQAKSPQQAPPPAPRTMIGQKQKINNSVSPRGIVAANTKHPTQIWSRDQAGSLHYTGMFSSDC